MPVALISASGIWPMHLDLLGPFGSYTVVLMALCNSAAVLVCVPSIRSGAGGGGQRPEARYRVRSASLQAGPARMEERPNIEPDPKLQFSSI